MPDRAGSPRPDDADPSPGLRLAGDLVEGGLAVAALVAMLAIGVSPWLAVPLSIVTYIAVALVRPARGRPAGQDDCLATEHPGGAADAGDGDHRQLPDGALTAFDAVAIQFGLTRREREILPLLAHRLTDREIAEQLTISHRTAMNHTANILGKLGLASRRDVATFVARHALPPDSAPPRGPG